MSHGPLSINSGVSQLNQHTHTHTITYIHTYISFSQQRCRFNRYYLKPAKLIVLGWVLQPMGPHFAGMNHSQWRNPTTPTFEITKVCRRMGEISATGNRIMWKLVINSEIYRCFYPIFSDKPMWSVLKQVVDDYQSSFTHGSWTENPSTVLFTFIHPL